ncbi:ABC transporter permease [Candidatus Pacearchaeota archaeon]|nr:ABC transporter permease [Candidatus Pacearchaeota archaeon]
MTFLDNRVVSARIAFQELQKFSDKNKLGLLWYILEPLVIFVALLLVFHGRVGQNIPIYPLYLLMGIMLLRLFLNTTREVLNVRDKSYFLKEHKKATLHTLIESTIIKNLFIHAGEVLIFIVIAGYLMHNLVLFIAYLPLLALFTLFLYGFSTTLFVLYQFIKDVSPAWQIASRALWFITPVFYQITNNPLLKTVNSFNPIYYLVELFRDILIYQRMPEFSILFGSLLLSIVFFALGSIAYKLSERKFLIST